MSGIGKKVYKINMEDGSIIRTYPTAKIAAEIEKMGESTMARYCQYSTVRNGILYTYKKPIDKNFKNLNYKETKCVVSVSPDGTISEFENCQKAADYFGYHESHVNRLCRKERGDNKTRTGYRFYFKDDYEKSNVEAPKEVKAEPVEIPTLKTDLGEDTQTNLRRSICQVLSIKINDRIKYNEQNYVISEDYYLMNKDEMINPGSLLDKKFEVLPTLYLGNVRICDTKNDNGIKVLYDFFIRRLNEENCDFTIHNTLYELLEFWQKEHHDEEIYTILKARLDKGCLD